MLYFYCKKCTLTELHHKPKGDVIMKRLTAVLLSLIFVVAIGATAFAAFDTSRICLLYTSDAADDYLTV